MEIVRAFIDGLKLVEYPRLQLDILESIDILLKLDDKWRINDEVEFAHFLELPEFNSLEVLEDLAGTCANNKIKAKA